MALRGNLRDFSLPDVFQLVTFSRKTGVLRIVRADGANGSVWFRDGEVFFASSNWHTQPLGERLVHSQRITPQALNRALELRANEPADGRRLGQILVDEAYVTDKVLESFVQDQIQDRIFDLMRWDDGEFDFEPMPAVVEEDIGLAVSIENIVMEGSRRLEEWARIRKKIPSMDVVFKMATAPGEGTFEISLKPTEWELLLLIDGTRSVAELAEATHRTDFEVARVVYGLFSAGLLEFASDEEIERSTARRQEREARLAALRAEQQEAARLAEVAAASRVEPVPAVVPQASPVPLSDTEPAHEVAPMYGDLPLIPVGAPVAPTQSEGPVEIPEFLGNQSAVPTEKDQAVLEEFMGTILRVPAAPSEPVTPISAPTPRIPVEEPAFMSAGPAEPVAEGLIGVSSVEELLGLEPQPVAPATPAPAIVAPVEAVIEPPREDLRPVASGTDQPAVEVGISTGDYARDLMALGLGEAVVPIVEPPAMQPVPAVTDSEVETGIATEPQASSQPDAATTVVVEPVESNEEGAADGGVGWIQEPEPPQAASGQDSDAAVVVDATTPAAVIGLGADEHEMDFTGLIESLDVDADVVDMPVREPAGVDPGSFDEEILLDDVAEPAQGVISTDAYLQDIEMGDLSLSGGLNDELSALTGASRRATVGRPQANVNPLPDELTSGLHRDLRVDRETLLKIIDGIEKL